MDRHQDVCFTAYMDAYITMNGVINPQCTYIGYIIRVHAYGRLQAILLVFGLPIARVFLPGTS